MLYTIASKKEWELAKSILECKKKKNPIYSGYKITLNNNKKLKHSFIYFNNNNNQEILVALSRHHYLGKGLQGKVKLIEDEHGNLYGIKKLKRGIESIAAQHELNMLKKLGYVHFSGKSPKWGYILQPFFQGLTLAEYLLTVELTEEQKGALAYHLAKAIQFLHHRGVAHGDISVNNSIINIGTNEPEIYQIDFGCIGSFACDIDDFKKLLKDSLDWDITPLNDAINIDVIVKQLEHYSKFKLPISTENLLIKLYSKKLSVSYTPETICLINTLRDLSKKTNDILKLNELFVFVKRCENQNPMMSKQFIDDSSDKKSQSWAEVLNIFKIRAMQIAHHNANLQSPTDCAHIKAYCNILGENEPGNLRIASDSMDKFEKIINFNPEEYERIKLGKYLQNYIDRIETYKTGNQINFEHGFWVCPESRGINRQANYYLACELRRHIKNYDIPLIALFSEENITHLRNQCNPKPNKEGIYSMELWSVIRSGRDFGKKQSNSSSQQGKNMCDPK